MNLRNKEVLIVGATGGIGKACAESLALHGARLFLTGRSASQLIQLERSLKPAIYPHKTCDLTKEEEIDALVKVCPPLDGLIYAAGVIQPQPIKYILGKHLRHMFQINYDGAVLLVSALIRAKKIQDHASLIFISSISSNFAHKGGALYAGSKAALNMFSKTLAIEFAHRKIRSNVITAAMVKTEIFEQATKAISQEKMTAHEKQYPLGFGKVTDVAQACIYLLSDESRWTTGTELVLDGGLTAGH